MSIGDMSQATGEARTSEPHPAGLNFQVARTLDEVLAAWEIVYQAYRDIGLIDPNQYRIHTAPQAIGSHVAVTAGVINGLTVSTLTVMADNPQGLPLDRVYAGELTSLRNNGHKLMEVGLFADRRRQLSRSAEALLQLMRYAFYFGVSQGVTDFVIGVHPRHSRFYIRSFGFEPVGTARTYPAVNNNPVMLLKGDLHAKLTARKHPALEYFMANPVPVELFDERFRFRPEQTADTRLANYLRERAKAASMAQTG